MFGRPARLLAAVCVADIFAGRGHRSRHVEHHRDAHAQISPGRGGRSTTPSSTNAPTMVVAEEYATKDWYGSVTKRYCKSGNTAPMQARSCRLPATDLIRAQDGDRQFGTGRQYQHRQYQPRHRTGLRLIDAGQQPVVQRAGCDNAKAANITIYTVQINTGGIRLRSCCNIAPGTDKLYLVTGPSQNFCRWSMRPDSRWPGCASQNYRRGAPGIRASRKTSRKSPAATAGLFYCRSARSRTN